MGLHSLILVNELYYYIFISKKEKNLHDPFWSFIWKL